MAEPGGDRANVPIRAVETTLAVLGALGRRPSGRVTEIADELGVSKSTVHNHLATLERHGYVVQSGDEYRLGLRSLTLGGHAQKHERLYQRAREEVDDLVERTGERCQVLVEEGGRGYYVYQALGDQAVTTDSHVGTQVYLHCTALGKAVLANLPEERVEGILDEHGLPEVTERSIGSREALYEELAEIRDTGVAFDDEERMLGMRCVAVPILDGDDRVAGAISVSGPRTRFQGEQYRETCPALLRETADVIEIKLQYD